MSFAVLSSEVLVLLPMNVRFWGGSQGCNYTFDVVMK